MPLQLTTPKQTGDLDPDAYGGEYQQARIVRTVHMAPAQCIEIIVEYGNTVDGVWETGIIPREVYMITDADYTALVSSTSAGAGEVYYLKISELLYQWLIDEGHFSGIYV